jgi:hypothetical protein
MQQTLARNRSRGPLKPIGLIHGEGANVTIVKIAAGNTVGKFGKTGSLRFLEKINSASPNIHAEGRDLALFNRKPWT